jgi:hypothetical protein
VFQSKKSAPKKSVDCAIVVGGHSSGAIYAREFTARGVPPVHVPAAPRPPAAYAAQPLPPEFVADLPFDEDLEDTLARLRQRPLRRYRPRYVVAGTDQAVGRADALAERLGLASNGSRLSSVRRDKYLTAELLRERGLNAPLQFRTAEPEAAAAWVRRHPEVARWVVKPTRSAGSDRVASCTTPEEVLAASRLIAGGTNVFGEKDDEVLVQEYLTSPDDDNEYVVNTCSLSDPETGRVEHRVVSIYRYEKISVNGAPFVYYARHLLPPSGGVQDKLAAYFFGCLDALQIRQGPCHGELRMTRRGPALVEANVGRPDGGGVPKLDGVCTGYDQVTLTVESLLAPERYRGRFTQPYRLLKRGLVAFFVSRRAGVLRRIPGLARLRSLPSYLDTIFLAEPGKPVSLTVDVTSLLGWAFLANADQKALEADYASLREAEASGGMFDIE